MWSTKRNYLSVYHTIGIDFKLKTLEVKGKRIRLQIWYSMLIAFVCCCILQSTANWLITFLVNMNSIS